MKSQALPEAVLRDWFPVVLELAKGKADPLGAAASERMRATLLRVIDRNKRKATEPIRAQLPNVFVWMQGTKIVVGADKPSSGVYEFARNGYLMTSPAVPGMEGLDLRGKPIRDEKREAEILRQLEGIALLFATDPQSKRFRRCDWAECGRFFFAKTRHERPHSFCCEEHRRAFDVANRDPEAVAAYMREYRRARARQLQAKKRRKKHG